MHNTHSSFSSGKKADFKIVVIKKPSGRELKIKRVGLANNR